MCHVHVHCPCAWSILAHEWIRAIICQCEIPETKVCISMLTNCLHWAVPPSFNLQCRPQLIADVLLSAAFLSLVPFTLHRYSTVSVLAGGVILFLLPHSKIFYCCLDWQRPTKLLKQTISTASCWDFEWLMMSNQDCAVVSASAWESTSKQ